MELRDLVTRFEKSEPLIWFCPLIKCCCARDCYGFRPKSIRFLYHPKGKSQLILDSSVWSQAFECREDIIKWGKNLVSPIIITCFIIDNEHCSIIDKFLELGGYNA